MFNSERYIQELITRVERETFWCEDCQVEIPKSEQYKDLINNHDDHQTTKITVIQGWISDDFP